MTIWTAKRSGSWKNFPERLLVVGAGPIGVELGQAFHRLGADVTIAQRSGRILTKEDTDVSEQMLGYLRGRKDLRSDSIRTLHRLYNVKKA